MDTLRLIPKIIIFIFLISSLAFAEGKPPFNYDLHMTTIAGKDPHVVVLLHGSGGSWHIAKTVKRSTAINKTLVSFNFPDHGGGDDAAKTTFGSIDELLPVLYVLKKLAVDEGHGQIDLYGFSAGAAAIINTLVVLNSDTYDHRLREMGIHIRDKNQILNAIICGKVLLDSPLKSIGEIKDLRGSNPYLLLLDERYKKNGMVPIESLSKLKGLQLNITVYFEKPDDIVFNRDDNLFIERLKQSNYNGRTTLLTGSYGGHNKFHNAIWEHYLK